MTTKRQDDLFPTTALVPARPTISPLAPSERSRAGVKAERRIVQEAHKQQLVIQEQWHKTEVAQRAIGGLFESEEQVFTDTARAIWETRMTSGADAELQRFIDRHAAQTIQEAAGHIRAATIGGTERILDEVSRSLNMDIKEPTGLLALLRGETE